MKHTLCYALVLSIVLPLAVPQARSASLSDESALQAQVAVAKEKEIAAKNRYDATAKKLQKDEVDLVERGGSLPQENLAKQLRKSKERWLDAQAARKKYEAVCEKAKNKIMTEKARDSMERRMYEKIKEEKAAKKRYDAATEKLQKEEVDLVERGDSLPQEELAKQLRQSKKEWLDAQAARKEQEAVLEKAKKKPL